jgi:hypothetical protein
MKNCTARCYLFETDKAVRYEPFKPMKGGAVNSSEKPVDRKAFAGSDSLCRRASNQQWVSRAEIYDFQTTERASHATRTPGVPARHFEATQQAGRPSELGASENRPSEFADPKDVRYESRITRLTGAYGG